MKSSCVQVCDCACYLANNIRRAEGILPSMQRVHNLLYLAARESTCIFGEGLVPCTFRCTDDGVICENSMNKPVTAEKAAPDAGRLTKNVLGVLNSILATYGGWSESELRSHILGEESWIAARRASNEGKDAVLCEDKIAQDARKISRLRALWSMSHRIYDPGCSEESDHLGSICLVH